MVPAGNSTELQCDSDKVLDQIEADHPRDSDNMRCCIKMFSEWLSQDAGASWSTLMAALSRKAVAENELVAKLQGTTYILFPT